MAKTKTPTDEKFEKIDFDLFEAIAAIDKKDYGYYDRLTEEQKKKFVPYMLIFWISTVKGNKDLQNYYLQSTNHYANKYLFNELVQKNPKLQWLMMCAASPGLGKQFHIWIPHIKDKVAKLKEAAKVTDMLEYYKKIYPNNDKNSLQEIAVTFSNQHKRKCYLAEKFPDLKLDDIEILSQILTDNEIEQYEKDYGAI
jgi:hypothetical protein